MLVSNKTPSYRHEEEEKEIQRQSSACSEHLNIPPARRLLCCSCTASIELRRNCKLKPTFETTSPHLSFKSRNQAPSGQYIRVNLESIRDQPWFNTGSTLGQYRVSLRSIRGQPWVNPGSICTAPPSHGASRSQLYESGASRGIERRRNHGGTRREGQVTSRGLHSSTFLLNVSTFVRYVGCLQGLH